MAGYELKLQQSQRQELLLLPRMLQSIQVLQLPSTELEGYLREAVEANETLRLEDPGRGAEGAPPPPRRRAAPQATERHDAWLESQPSPPGMHARLEEQLGLLEVEDEILPWVRLLIECLDGNGYLSAPDDTLLELATERGLAPDPGRLGQAIAAVQRLEPRGIGGRDAIEALLLQLDPREADYALLCRLLEDFLEEVAKNKLPAVAKALGIDLARLDGLLERLRELRLRPAAGLVDETPGPIRPDVVVERRGQGFEVRVELSGLPAVSIDPRVAALAKDGRQSAAVRRYLRGKLERARWLLESLEQRRETLLRVASAAFGHQQEFLTHGPDHVRPLRMGQLADELGLHVSTISRAVAGKHADTPWGILPLRSFFQGSAGGDEEATRDHVAERIRGIIGGEDPRDPLSDDAVAQVLSQAGIELARRTVAKYRAELGIPSSYRRRRWSA